MISRFRIRYVPTAGLAMAPAGWQRRQCTTAVVLGHLYPHLGDDAVQATFAELSRVVPGCVVLRPPLPAPSPVFANLLDRLVVLDDLGMGGEPGPYGWSPLPLDRNRAAGRWPTGCRSPGADRRRSILPGFHTAAEDALKKVGRAAPGNEIFLSVCGLMASGVRTILLSRWRSGGQSSLDLVREFAQELPHADAGRLLAAGGAGRSRLPLEPRCGTAHQARRRRRAAAGQPPVLLGRIHAGRLRQPRPGPPARKTVNE